MFEPVEDTHSVVEAVFGIIFVRRFTPSDFVRIDDAKGTFTDRLPKVSRIDDFNIALGSIPTANFPATKSPGGIIFDRMKPNGEIEWRLKVEDNSIYVNCLNYKGRSDFFPKATEMISDIIKLLSGSNNAAGSFQLQYINEYNWSGPLEGYDPKLLLKVDGEMMPGAVFSKGPFWHSHQGWFESTDTPVPGKLLKRGHIDGLQRPSGQYFIRVDVLNRVDCASPIGIKALEGTPAIVNEHAVALHQLVKAMVGSYITDKVAERIALWR
jgi:uncharacterized protein (TIGR04255 family)